MLADDETKKREEDEMVAILLSDVPELVSMWREILEKVIRSAFSGGWKLGILFQEHTATEIVQ